MDTIETIRDTLKQIDATQKELVRLRNEDAIRWAKWREELDVMHKKLGGIDNNLGDDAEQFFQDIFANTLSFGGEKYDFMSPNLQRRMKNVEAEFDIVLVNGKSVAIIEAKHKLHPDNVADLVENKVPKFRQLFSEYKNHKLYLGVAGFSMSKAVSTQAKKYGIGIIKPDGNSVEMEVDNLKAY